MTLLQELVQRVSADVLATRDPLAIAEAASRGRTQVVSTKIGPGDVLTVLGPDGGAFLDGLEALGAQAPNVKWALLLLKDARLDVGLESTRAQVQQIAASRPEIANACAALLALAVRPAPVSEYEIRCALWDAEGNWLGG